MRDPSVFTHISYGCFEILYPDEKRQHPQSGLCLCCLVPIKRSFLPSPPVLQGSRLTRSFPLGVFSTWQCSKFTSRSGLVLLCLLSHITLSIPQRKSFSHTRLVEALGQELFRGGVIRMKASQPTELGFRSTF